MKKKEQEDIRNLGFTNTVFSQNSRLMNTDGTSNLKRVGGPFIKSLNTYHSLIIMSWAKFNLIVIGYFLFANILFAFLYLAAGLEQLSGMVFTTPLEKFWEAFFFSAQTLTTVGYGRINPVGTTASAIASIESLLGLMGFALATGLIYGRFSRPVAKVLFSKNFLIAPYRGITAIMFRTANMRKSELLEVEAVVNLSYVDDVDGKPVRKFTNLNLELNKVTLFSTTWTVVHPIDESSPVYGWTKDDFEKHDIELLVLMKGYEETFAQTVHARSSYKHFEMVYGGKFTGLIRQEEGGMVIVELDKIGNHEVVVLN
jgi:inward rectifier potassium channel